VPPGTNTGQKLRLSKRGLPKRREGEGDLFAIVQIVVPPALTEREKTVFKELADASTFNPRASFPTGEMK
jgi:curved DNA-binding protein